MRTMREAIQMLGWPVGMSDNEIAHEMLRRWFSEPRIQPLELSDPIIIARCIYASLARESGLDALCWDSETIDTESRRSATDHELAMIDAMVHSQQTKHDFADSDFDQMNRRKSVRRPRSELTDILLDYGAHRAQGWLIDLSMGGAALLMDGVHIPVTGQHIESVVHQRSGDTSSLGPGVVIRTELLSNDLGLVCVEFDEPIEEAA